MVDQLGNICTHPDLNLADPPTVNVNNIAQEASWAEYNSSKFLFLSYFIDSALSRDLHVIVMVKNGRAAKVLETYFLGKEFALRAAPSGSVGVAEMLFYRNSLSFGIRITSDQSVKDPFKIPALIIALDDSFDVDSEPVRRLRVTDDPERPAPVVRLVIANTTEHIQLCLPDCSDLMKLRLLAKHANQFCDNAGELQDNALGVQEDAEEILTYLTMDPASRKWPLPSIEALEIEASEDQKFVPEPEALRSMTSSRQKRWLVSGAEPQALVNCSC
jgi:hypothetical protein